MSDYLAIASPCPACQDSGWKPHIDANGERAWRPLMNDALPCECGALARKYKAEKDAAAIRQETKE